MPMKLEHVPLLDDDQIELLREALDEGELYAMFSDLPRAAQQAVEGIQEGIKAGRLDQVRKEAHVLKGVAGSFGAARLASIAREIETEMPSIEIVTCRIPVLVSILEGTLAVLPGSSTPALSGVES